MKLNKKTIIGGVVLVLVLAVVAVILVWNHTKQNRIPSNLGPFATCLKDKGALFYGASWCPHCQNEKKLFGTAVNLIPYVECSTPDGSAQTQNCKDQKITGYPTWVFADGSRLDGEVPLDTLAQKTNCALPL